ncbi:MAG: hypothetical protein Q4G52_04535 [Clostridia bacterium]|nr:hypothetical protein [Clostridia bacterium]
MLDDKGKSASLDRPSMAVSLSRRRGFRPYAGVVGYYNTFFNRCATLGLHFSAIFSKIHEKRGNRIGIVLASIAFIGVIGK